MNLSPEAWSLAGVVAVVIVLWFTEALPLAVTALVGAAACVVLGVAPAKEVFRPFADPLIFLFIGSFLLAEAFRIHRLDRRLAYAVLAVPWVGERPRRLLAAVAVVAAVVSAFLSNTVTAALMLAIVAGLVAAIEEAAEPAARPAPTFATGLYLCIAFAASIGGLATPIGTPTNLIGLRLIRTELETPISFPGWCAVTLPVVAVLVVVVVLLLGRLFPAGVDRLAGVSRHVAAERARLGPWTTAQRSTVLAFGITVALWVVPGVLLGLLGEQHPVVKRLQDRLPEGVAAIVGAALLFLLPGGRAESGRWRPVLRWQEARIEWDIVLLYGGGLALGELCFSTGLAAAIGGNIRHWIPSGPWADVALVAAAALVAAVTSEFTSNVASATMVVPVVIAVAMAAGGDAVTAALAATLAASLGFMMPVSSPCNAIVYGSGRIPLRAMMAAGAILDVIGVAVITATLLLIRGSPGG